MEHNIKMNVWSQITSGRWLLTVAAALGLLSMTVTVCWQGVHGINPFMDPGGLLAVYTMVFMAYFQKPTEGVSGKASDTEAATPVKQ